MFALFYIQSNCPSITFSWIAVNCIFAWLNFYALESFSALGDTQLHNHINLKNPRRFQKCCIVGNFGSHVCLVSVTGCVAVWVNALSVSISTELVFILKINTEACNLIKKETLTQVSSCEFRRCFRNTFFKEDLWGCFFS